MDDVKQRLTRRPSESDIEWLEDVRAAKRGDTVELEIRYKKPIKRMAQTFSWSSMQRGVRIYADEYESVLWASLWRAVDVWNEVDDPVSVICACQQNAVRDLWRQCNTRAESINRRAISYETIQFEMADADTRKQPEAALMASELIAAIGNHTEIDDQTKQIARLVADGYSNREIGRQLGIHHEQVKRKMRSICHLLADWR